MRTLVIIFFPVWLSAQSVTISNINYRLITSEAGADITKELQTSLDTFKNVLIEKAYKISGVIEIKSGRRLKGRGSAVLVSNKLTVLNIPGDSSIVEDIQFASSETDPTGWAKSVIFVRGKRNIIRGATFNYNFRTGAPTGVWLTGNTAAYNSVESNKFNTVGIAYDNRASYNTIKGNVIVSSASNSIAGMGNGSTPCVNNKIQGNTILNAGRIGIEDIQNTVNTLIESNTVIGTGFLFPVGEDMGISAVGITPMVKTNIIKYFKTMAIELVGNSGGTADGNIIEDTTLSYSGIMCNYVSSNLFNKGATIKNNKIKGCNWAIDLYGGYKPKAIITGNSITDFKEKGIRMDCNGDSLSVSITGNKFYYNRPSTVTRYGMVLMGGTVAQKLTVSGNQFIYNGIPKEFEVITNIKQ